MRYKTLYIIKVGTTFPATAHQFGDFDQWTAATLGVSASEICIVNAEQGDVLPPCDHCAGVIITGSHAMVTDNLPWSVALEKWIPLLLERQVPILGICYGHQILAHAAGGEVGFHPQGKEIGTVDVHLSPDAAVDPLFNALPPSFSVHVTHAQTVLTLPDNARCLASNDFEPHHAFRLGGCAWGVQFHPEYSAHIMRSYIEEQAEELLTAGRDIVVLMETVQETSVAAEILRRFGNFALAR